MFHIDMKGRGLYTWSNSFHFEKFLVFFKSWHWFWNFKVVLTYRKVDLNVENRRIKLCNIFFEALGLKCYEVIFQNNLYEANVNGIITPFKPHSNFAWLRQWHGKNFLNHPKIILNILLKTRRYSSLDQ